MQKVPSKDIKIPYQGYPTWALSIGWARRKADLEEDRADSVPTFPIFTGERPGLFHSRVFILYHAIAV